MAVLGVTSVECSRLSIAAVRRPTNGIFSMNAILHSGYSLCFTSKHYFWCNARHTSGLYSFLYLWAGIYVVVLSFILPQTLKQLCPWAKAGTQPRDSPYGRTWYSLSKHVWQLLTSIYLILFSIWIYGKKNKFQKIDSLMFKFPLCFYWKWPGTNLNSSEFYIGSRFTFVRSMGP